MGYVVSILFIIIGLLMIVGAAFGSMKMSNLDNHCVTEGMGGVLFIGIGIVVLILLLKGIAA